MSQFDIMSLTMTTNPPVSLFTLTYLSRLPSVPSCPYDTRSDSSPGSFLESSKEVKSSNTHGKQTYKRKY